MTAATHWTTPKANKTDAGNGSDGICRVIDASRSPSPDPKRSATIMSHPPHRILLLLGAILMSSCTTAHKEPFTSASCCSPLPLGRIAEELGLHMEELGMHGYRFYNERYEFELLASSDEIHLVDESTEKSDKFSPVWTLKGAISEHDLKSKIRTYLHGK
jgi:hypothetical protein